MIRKTVLVQISVLILVLFLSGCTMDDNPDSRIPESDPALQSSAGNEDLTEDISPAITKEPGTDNTSGYSDNYVPELDSGKYTVSTEEVVIYTDRAIVYLEPNVFYPKNLADFVNETVEIIEQETGLSFLNDNRIGNMLYVHVQHANIPYSTEHGAFVQPMDVLPNCIETIFHELSHTIQLQACSDIKMRTLSEGFAIVNAFRVSGKSSLPNLFDPFFNYSFFENEELMMSDPERFIMEAEGWDTYLAGFRFVYYLEEKYGKTICPRIFTRIGEMYPDGCSNSELIEIVKSMTSEDVFHDFKEWYGSEREKFARSYPVVSLDKTGYLEVFPVYNENTKVYFMPEFTYQGSITLDFTGGFEYLQFLGHNVKGIFGTVQSEGEHTLSFYDAYGELVCTKQVSNSQIRLDTPKAVKIEITGDGSLIHIVPDFDLMTD